MNKISGILPANSRLRSVDLDSSHPVRPGTPAFGRPEGSTSSVRDRVSITSAGAADSGAPAAMVNLVYKNPREAAQSKIAEDMTKKFFDTRLDLKPIEEPASGQNMDSELAGKQFTPDDSLETLESQVLYPNQMPSSPAGLEAT